MAQPFYWEAFGEWGPLAEGWLGILPELGEGIWWGANFPWDWELGIWRNPVPAELTSLKPKGLIITLGSIGHSWNQGGLWGRFPLEGRDILLERADSNRGKLFVADLPKKGEKIPFFLGIGREIKREGEELGLFGITPSYWRKVWGWEDRPGKDIKFWDGTFPNSNPGR